MRGGPWEAPLVAPVSTLDWIGSITLRQMGELLPCTVPECILLLGHGVIEENASAYRVWASRMEDLEYLFWS